MKKVVHGTPLEEWFANAGGRVPFEMALYMLEPVVRSLAALHAGGQGKLDIGADSVAVDAAGRAMLLERAAKKTGNPKPGYTAPEQYRANGKSGPWSDVYAVGALLWRMVMGRPLPDAFRRLESDAEVRQGVESLLPGDARGQAWLRALDMNAEQRTHNCGMLAAELYGAGTLPQPPSGQPYAQPIQPFVQYGQPEQAQPLQQPYAQLPYGEAYQQMPYGQTGAQQAYPYAQPVGQKKRFKKKLWIPVIAAGAVAVAIGVFFILAETNYQQAAQYTTKGSYTKAIESLSTVPGFYRDAQTLMNYDFAQQQLQAGNLDQAKEWFEKLGDYRDSKTMVTETDYQKAEAVLKNKQYDQAKQAFAALGSYKDAQDMAASGVDYRQAKDLLAAGQYDDAKNIFSNLGSYKDSATMVQEADYQKAKSLIEKGNLINAILILKDIPNYSDVSDFLPQLYEMAYEMEVDQYNTGDRFSLDFSTLSGYKDADKYAVLVAASNGSADYSSLIALTGFADADKLIMSDYYIYDYLKGNWTDGNYYFWLKENSDSGYSTQFNMPWYSGDYFDIRDSIYYVGSDPNNLNREQFKFEFVSSNEMYVYCFQNNQLYHMVRL